MKETGAEVCFFACIDRSSKYQSAGFSKKSVGVIVAKFPQDFVNIHGIPRILLTFCTQKNNDICDAPVNEHKAFGLVEQMTQTVEHRLSCFNLNKDKDFNRKPAIISINYQVLI